MNSRHILLLCALFAPIGFSLAYAQQTKVVAKPKKKTIRQGEALMNLQKPPMQEELHELKIKWKSSGYFALRKYPKDRSKIVGQIKAVSSKALEREKDIIHIMRPTIDHVKESFNEVVTDTITPSDRTPQTRRVKADAGDPLYGYRYTSEGTADVGVYNRIDGKMVIFQGVTDEGFPSINNPKEKQWWLFVKGEKSQRGWLKYNPKHIHAELKSWVGVSPSMN